MKIYVIAYLDYGSHQFETFFVNKEDAKIFIEEHGDEKFWICEIEEGMRVDGDFTPPSNIERIKGRVEC